MLLDTSTATLNLGRDEMARLDNACDTRIDCVDGVAWITIDGDRRDIVLSRGQSFSVESNQRVIVCALNGAAAVDVHTRPGRTRCAPVRRAPALWSGMQSWLRSTTLGTMS